MQSSTSVISGKTLDVTGLGVMNSMAVIRIHLLGEKEYFAPQCFGMRLDHFKICSQVQQLRDTCTHLVVHLFYPAQGTRLAFHSKAVFLAYKADFCHESDLNTLQIFNKTFSSINKYRYNEGLESLIGKYGYPEKHEAQFHHFVLRFAPFSEQSGG